MSALRVGIVGGGFMASVHTRAARAAGARVAGIASSSPERARQAASALGIDEAADDLDALLGSGVDVVHVCTPNALHAAQARRVLEAGVDVVCEKPLATAVPDAEGLVQAAQGRTAAVPFVYRFHPMVRHARAQFSSGRAGRVLSIRGSYLQDWMLGVEDDNWRVDAEAGGPSRAFADIGSHLIDLVEFVTGDRVRRLSAVTSTVFDDRAQHRGIRTEDAAAVTLETAGGAIGTLLVSQTAPGRKNALTLEIAGSAESVAFEQEHPETLWIGRRSGSTLVPRDADQIAPDAARLCRVPAGHPQGYLDAFDAFVADVYDAVGGGEPEGLPRFDDGLRAVRITDAVLQAASTKTWVDVPHEG